MRTTSSARSLLAFAALALAIPAHAGGGVAHRVHKAKRRAHRMTSRANVKAHMHAKTGAKAKGCRGLAHSTVASCKVLVLRGVDTGCYQAITTLDMARQQAKGKLFDAKKYTGKASTNVQVAESTCQVQLDDLRTEAKNDAAEVKKAPAPGPRCKALEKKLEADCYPKFEKAVVPSSCSQAINMLTSGMAKGEAACGAAELAFQ